MIRILHVFGKMDCGGAETLIMRIYRKIDRTKIQFDFLVTESGEGYYDVEIKELGGRIYVIKSSKNNLINHIREIYSILKNKDSFHAVHAHTSYNSGFVCFLAYLANIKIRVSHSHTTSNNNTKGLQREWYFKLMRLLITVFSTHKVACGEKAAVFLFGKAMLERGKVTIIKNAIDYSLYEGLNFRNLKLRECISNDLKDNVLVLGHVGSFQQLKNHKFILKILSRLVQEQIAFKMIFVGAGELRLEIENEIKKLKLNKYFIFLGLRSDIPELMAMFDILLLPSLYEGVPTVVVEAQAAGTPCLVSNTVTREVDIGLGLVDFLSIKRADVWCSKIIDRKIKNDRELGIGEALYAHGWNIESSLSKFYKLYGLRI